jgi:hypothetical protein
MKTAGIVVVGLLLTAATSAAGQHPHQQECCLRYPLRVVGGHGVNLTPLFTWWTNSSKADEHHVAAERPLASWVRITGLPPGAGRAPWVMDADVYWPTGGVEHAKIALRHPPESDRQKFNELKRDEGLLTQRYGSLVATLRKSLRQTRDYNEAAKLNRTAGHEARAQQSDDAGTASLRQYVAASSSLVDVGRALERVRAALKAFPPGDVYRLDFIALATAEKHQGLTLFDCGLLREK